MSWSFYRTVTVDHTKVPNTDLTNFPVPVAGTFAYLATVANGGLVTNGSGFDIAFFSDAALTVPLKFERVIYVATSGKVLFYVKVPTLSHTVDTVIYMAYANAAISTDQQDAVNTWDANFAAVFHFGDGTTLSGADSKGAFALTNVGGVAAAGAIGGALSVTGSQYMERTASVPFTALPATIEMLIKPAASIVATTSIVGLDASASTLGFVLQAKATDAVRVINGTGGVDPSSANGILNTTNWHYAAAMFSSATARRLLLDGAAAVTGVANAGTVVTPDNLTVGVAHSGSVYSQFFNGLVAEVRLSTVVRSDDWATTTFNSLVNNASFYAIGTQQTPATPASIITTQPSHTATGVVMSPSPVAKATTDGSTIDTGFVGTCTATLTSVNGNGSIGGTVTVTCVAGVATFANLIPAGDGSEYTLTFTMSGYTPIVSGAFTIIGPTVVANQALVTLFGGNLQLFHVCDPRVYANATALATLKDTIGTVGGRAAGLTFSQATGGNQPVVTSGKIVLNGSAWMFGAQDTRLSLDGSTPVYVIALMEATAAGPLIGMAADVTSLVVYPWASLESGASTFKGNFAPTAALTINPDSGMTIGAGIIRASALGKAARTGNGNVDEMWRYFHAGVQDHNHKIVAVATTVVSGLFPFMGKLASAVGTGKISWFAYSTVDPTGTIWNGLRSFFTTQFPTSALTSSKWGTHAEVGSSIARGSNGTDPMNPAVGSGTTSYPYVCATATTGPRAATWAALGMCANEVHEYNRGRSGGNVLDIVNTWATDIAPLFDGSRPGPSWIELDGGAIGNGIQGLGWDYAATMAQIDALWALCKAAGCKLVITPCADRGTGTNNSNGNSTGWYVDGALAVLANAGNTLVATHNELRDNTWLHCDGFVTSIMTHPAFQVLRATTRACTDGAYYQADKVHGQNLYYSTMGTEKRAFYDARDGYPFPLAHLGHTNIHRGGLMSLAGGF